MNMILPGILSGIALLVVLMQFDFKKILGYSLFVDIIATALLAWIFAGTYSGMMAGVVGGLFITLVLAASKYCMGYKKLTFKGWKEYT